MTRKFSCYILITTILSQSIGCSSHTSIDNFFKNRNQLNGKIVNIQGFLQSNKGPIQICKKIPNDRCIYLEYGDAYRDIFIKKHGEIINIEGIYKEHGYSEIRGNVEFMPSRIFVLRLLPNTN